MPTEVHRFSIPRQRRFGGRPAIGAVIALIAFLGSLLAATLGPAGDPRPFPLRVLLVLIRG